MPAGRTERRGTVPRSTAVDHQAEQGHTVRLVDLRGSTAAAPPTVEVRASEAAELLRLVGVVAGDDDGADYDVGAERIARVRDALPSELVERAGVLHGGDHRAFFSLSNAAARLDAPGDVDQLLELLRDEPHLPWQLLVSLAAQDADDDGVAAAGRALARGEPDALERLRSRCPATGSGASTRLRRLLDADPDEHGAEVATVVGAVRDAVWSRVGPEAMAAIHRDVDHRRERIADGEDVAELVLDATNGYALEEDPSVRRILLLPSFWLRPWIVVDQLFDSGTLVLSTPVADAFVALPAEVPPPSLLKLTKALADEGRLKLLRRMTTGPVSLGEATEQLGVAKATAHHHLSILRQSGIVVMHGTGRSTRYGLRADPADVAREALSAYVPLRGDAGDRVSPDARPGDEAQNSTTIPST
jgi:DNA-binding transcriptional ArsR family regulator